HLGGQLAGQSIGVDQEPLHQGRYLGHLSGTKAFAHHLQAAAQDVDGDGPRLVLRDGAEARIPTDEAAGPRRVDPGRAVIGAAPASTGGTSARGSAVGRWTGVTTPAATSCRRPRRAPIASSGGPGRHPISSPSRKVSSSQTAPACTMQLVPSNAGTGLGAGKRVPARRARNECSHSRSAIVASSGRYKLGSRRRSP